MASRLQAIASGGAGRRLRGGMARGTIWALGRFKLSLRRWLGSGDRMVAGLCGRQAADGTELGGMNDQAGDRARWWRSAGGRASWRSAAVRGGRPDVRHLGAVVYRRLGWGD